VEAASEEATVEPVASSGFKGGHYSQFKKRWTYAPKKKGAKTSGKRKAKRVVGVGAEPPLEAEEEATVEAVEAEPPTVEHTEPKKRRGRKPVVDPAEAEATVEQRQPKKRRVRAPKKTATVEELVEAAEVPTVEPAEVPVEAAEVPTVEEPMHESLVGIYCFRVPLAPAVFWVEFLEFRWNPEWPELLWQ
jgi:hypothetical protein